MSWCNYCEDSGGFFSTSYTCMLDNNYIPLSYVNNYCKYDYKVSNCPNYKKYGPVGTSVCFITTVTCNIMGKDDNDVAMEKLRGFRNDILQKNEKYYEILKLYDSIGPILAEELINDKDKEIFIPKLYQVLEKITELIDKKEYDEAIEKYIIMTLLLINRYDLKHRYNNIMDNDYEYENNFNPEIAGHGKKLGKNNGEYYE